MPRSVPCLASSHRSTLDQRCPLTISLDVHKWTDSARYANAIIVVAPVFGSVRPHRDVSRIAMMAALVLGSVRPHRQVSRTRAHEC
eukprot:2422497-Rhodomonas_salina.1